ncbi:MAG: NADH-quinone oxidoreductase subunit H [Bacteroidales bacterium]|nr:MAG: NADH-quinone oxidoreductase subunit H [Bacteroidales bacterium]
MFWEKFKTIVKKIYLSLTDKEAWLALFFSVYFNISKLRNKISNIKFDVITDTLGRYIKLYLYVTFTLYFIFSLETAFWIFFLGPTSNGWVYDILCANNDIETILNMLGFGLVLKALGCLLALLFFISRFISLVCSFGEYCFWKFFGFSTETQALELPVESFFDNPQVLLLLSFLWNFLLTVVGILLATALLTLLERKIMASVQRRRGPNVVGFFGLLQPFADGLKLAIKETTVPKLATKTLFVLGPIISFGLAVFGWVLIPFPTWLHSTKDYTYYSSFSFFNQTVPGSSAIDLEVGLLFLFVVVALHVYGVLFGGWGSNSRYALLGALRATAQSISYELVMGFTLLILALCHGGFSLLVIIYDQSVVWNMFSLLPVFLIFYVCALAELNRTPFDLVEAEGELVAGYNVEYSAMMFALYFLGEYISIIFSAFTMVTLFLGAWFFPSFFSLITFVFSCLFSNTIFSFIIFLFSVLAFVLKITVVIISSLMIRFVLPRYRYDQLMNIGWLVFLPISLFFLIFYANIVLF